MTETEVEKAAIKWAGNIHLNGCGCITAFKAGAEYMKKDIVAQLRKECDGDSYYPLSGTANWLEHNEPFTPRKS